MHNNIMEKQLFTLAKAIYLLLCITLITACAYRDEGEIDYRRADKPMEVENEQGKITRGTVEKVPSSLKRNRLRH